MYHAVVVIFLEFFAWGLLTTPMLVVSIMIDTVFPSYVALYPVNDRGVKYSILNLSVIASSLAFHRPS